MALDWALRREIERAQPTSILEIGCGNSTWLGYLAKEYGCTVAGIDYSPVGCALARERLAAEGVDGWIFCGDMLNAALDDVGRYDFVFSWGVVEHFDNPEVAIRAALRFVNPGGFLFTEVPNLLSIYGLVSWVWHPADLAKHHVVTRRSLARVYRERLGLRSVRACHIGIFSLRRIPWERYPRWPRVTSVLRPYIGRAIRLSDRVLRRFGAFRGLPYLAPYVVACGQRPTVEDAIECAP